MTRLSIEQTVSSFLKTHADKKRPLLLGLSGGPDSLLLYHLLLNENFPFEVLHVNHRWREESDHEALYLEKMARNDHIPFHLKTLGVSGEEKNLENLGRIARLAFFKEIFHARSAQCILLGHHQGDQAETVLKRVFEGASLPHLKGLSFISEIQGLKIWRPLLTVKKEDILLWHQARATTPFNDHTNLDPRFLRARLRTDLLPYLSEKFGKEISSSLCRLGHSANELHEFLETILQSYRARYEQREGMRVLDVSTFSPSTLFEWKLVIRDFFNRVEIAISTHSIETIVNHLKKRSSNKELIVGKCLIKIHQGVLTQINLK